MMKEASESILTKFFIGSCGKDKFMPCHIHDLGGHRDCIPFCLMTEEKKFSKAS
jgi:hypothetical protein